MGGVAKQDQMLACFLVMRKYVKGYKNVFYLLDIALYDADILHSKVNCRTISSIASFCLAIAEKLLEQATVPN